MNRSVVNLIAVAERNVRGYADVPPGSINDEIESELAVYGYAIAESDRLWVGGHRIHTPESVLFGNYRLYVPRSIFTCTSSQSPAPSRTSSRPFTITELLRTMKRLLTSRR
jgi:hypothetical protein